MLLYLDLDLLVFVIDLYIEQCFLNSINIYHIKLLDEYIRIQIYFFLIIIHFYINFKLSIKF